MSIDLFTEDEVRSAHTILKSSMDGRQTHQRILDTIVTDEVMARIDLSTGQRNDRSYIAYRLEYVAART